MASWRESPAQKPCVLPVARDPGGPAAVVRYRAAPCKLPTAVTCCTLLSHSTLLPLTACCTHAARCCHLLHVAAAVRCCSSWNAKSSWREPSLPQAAVAPASLAQGSTSLQKGWGKDWPCTSAHTSKMVSSKKACAAKTSLHWRFQALRMTP